MIVLTNGYGDSYIYSRAGRYGVRWDWDNETKVHIRRLIDIETNIQKDLAIDSMGIHSQPVWLSLP